MEKLITAASYGNDPCPSLWAATAPAAPDTVPLRDDVRVDACVIGAGYTGLSAALHLSAHGASVCVLEARDIGWGASGRNGGQVNPQYRIEESALERKFGVARAARMLEFVRASGDLVFKLIEDYAIDCDGRRSGWIQALHSDRAIPLMEARQAAWARHGVDLDWLSRDDMERLTGSRAYVAGLRDRRAGRVQPLAFARGLARAAIDQGAAIHTNSPAQSLTRSDQAWHVATQHGNVIAEQIIVGTNGYTDHLVPDLAQSVLPLCSYQIATEPLSHNHARTVLADGHTLSDTRRLLTYMRSEPDGRVVLGGYGGFSESNDPLDYRPLGDRLAELLPQLKRPKWDYFWGGRVAVTNDHLPHWHEPAPGLLAGLGYNGRGVAMATSMGKLLADRALGASSASLPLPIAPLRHFPLRGLRLPLIAALKRWYGVLDRRELPSSRM